MLRRTPCGFPSASDWRHAVADCRYSFRDVAITSTGRKNRVCAVPELLCGSGKWAANVGSNGLMHRSAGLGRGAPLLARADAVGAEDVGEGDDAEDFADVGAAYYGECVEVRVAHSLQRQVERMIGVDVGEVAGVERAQR